MCMELLLINKFFFWLNWNLVMVRIYKINYLDGCRLRGMYLNLVSDFYDVGIWFCVLFVFFCSII